MTAIPLESGSESDQKAIRDELGRILNSGPFAQSRRRQRFLEYIVNETLAGRGDRLKGYNIAVEVFDRPETFDPVVDPLVRIEAARLREKLREYYDTDGLADPVRIELPKGTYTPHIAFRSEAPPSAPPDRPSGAVTTEPRSRKISWAASALAVLLLLLAALGAWRWWTPSTPLSQKASIAVLPFENIGSDPKWDRFADGITEDIVTDLSHSKDLFVVARNSTEVYKGKPADVRSIGRDLGVRYVLEGSVQPSGDQVRVTAAADRRKHRTAMFGPSVIFDPAVDDLFDGPERRDAKELRRRLPVMKARWPRPSARLIRRKPPSEPDRVSRPICWPWRRSMAAPAAALRGGSGRRPTTVPQGARNRSAASRSAYVRDWRTVQSIGSTSDWAPSFDQTSPS